MRNGGRNFTLADYRLFLDKLGEFESFSALVEERLLNLESGPDMRLERQLARLNLLIVRASLKASQAFLGDVRQRREMPLGSHEIFSNDLDNLGQIRARSQSRGWQDVMDDDTMTLMDSVEQLLIQLKDRAPALPELAGPVVRRKIAPLGGERIDPRRIHRPPHLGGQGVFKA